MNNGPIDLSGSNLTQDQIQLLQNLLPTLTKGQIQWLAGYFSGLNVANQLNFSQNGGEVVSTGISSNAPELTILFGTRTGNSQYVAEIAEQIAIAKGMKPVMKDMMSYKPKSFKKETNVLVIVSTDGEGEPPFAARELHEFLGGNRAPKLKETNYAVLGLGDKTYQFFCQTGKDFDTFLDKAGATKVYDRAELDLDFEEPAEEWLNIVIDKFAEKLGAQANPAIQTTGVGIKPKSQYNKKNPFQAQLLEKINLNGRGSDKETYHLELSLEDSGLEYEPGDALGIFATNSEKAVSEVILAGNFNEDAKVKVDEEVKTFKEALINSFEITLLNRELIINYNEKAGSEELREILANNDQLKDFLWGTDVADLLSKYPASISEQELINILHKMPPRLYSIASSLEANPEEVHLTVGAVRYEKDGRKREGVGSTFFADRLNLDDTVAVYIDKNRGFKLPEDGNKPIIMVGPGTGIAPFRSFVQEREEKGAEGKNWLFFGDQHFTTDFLYQTEWQQFLKDGVLTKLNVAFSRDQKEKVYVQDRMLENSAELFAWLEEGAYFYVCGDKNRMAKDVHNTLIKIVEKEGGKSANEAEEYVNNLMKERRYQEDVY